jgi:hypothetical protein
MGSWFSSIYDYVGPLSMPIQELSQWVENGETETAAKSMDSHLTVAQTMRATPGGAEKMLEGTNWVHIGSAEGGALAPTAIILKVTIMLTDFGNSPRIAAAATATAQDPGVTSLHPVPSTKVHSLSDRNASNDNFCSLSIKRSN